MSDLMRSALRRLIDLGSRSRPRIFISYRRRGEGAGYAGRLADRLVHEFGPDQCFRDIDDIESGTDFVEEISRAVGGCEVLIVVIGPDWLDARDRDGLRRLDDPRDFVRIEVAAALARGIRVVPVLVGGAAVPPAALLPAAIEGLSRRQAHELTDSRWDYDVGLLIQSIEGMGVSRRTKSRPGRRRWKRLAVAGSLVAATVVAVPAALGLIDAAAGNATGDTFLPNQGAQAPPSLTDDTGMPDGMNQVMRAMAANAGVQPVTSGAREDLKVDLQTVQALRASLSDAADDGWRSEIVDAMRRANDAEVRAQRTHDALVLEEAFTGEALELEIYALGLLQMAGQRSVNRLHDQRILSIDLSRDGSHAVVEAIETWSSTRYDAGTDICLFRLAPHDVPQTVHLVRQHGSWIVSALMTRGTEPAQLSCG